MAKEDVPPLPDKVPRNRRQVEAILDVHLAQWLAGEMLTPGERKKLQAEKDRRKTLKPELVVGVVCGNEGATPEQLRTLREVLPRIAPTKIVQHPLPGKVNHVVRKMESDTVKREILVDGDGSSTHRALLMIAVARRCNTLVAIQKETNIQPMQVGNNTRGVVSAIGLARHRGIPVRVILPNGKEERL